MKSGERGEEEKEEEKEDEDKDEEEDASRRNSEEVNYFCPLMSICSPMTSKARSKLRWSTAALST
jgi:hypothetical protein